MDVTGAQQVVKWRSKEKGGAVWKKKERENHDDNVLMGLGKQEKLNDSTIIQSTRQNFGFKNLGLNVNFGLVTWNKTFVHWANFHWKEGSYSCCFIVTITYFKLCYFYTMQCAMEKKKQTHYSNEGWELLENKDEQGKECQPRLLAGLEHTR
jgi:hypothetical protein